MVAYEFLLLCLDLKKGTKLALEVGGIEKREGYKHLFP